ncbi:MAG: putative motility protein [Nitrospirae bacterium]|nr:putative motility protein [Nitrospirota bacterium]
MVGGIGSSSGNVADSVNVNVIKKNLDMMKAEGAAVVDLIDKAGAAGQAKSPQKPANPEGTGAVVNKYA